MKKITTKSIKSTLSATPARNVHTLNVFPTSYLRQVQEREEMDERTQIKDTKEKLNKFLKLLKKDFKSNVEDYGDQSIQRSVLQRDSLQLILKADAEPQWKKRNDLGDVIFKVISRSRDLNGGHPNDPTNWLVDYKLKEL